MEDYLIELKQVDEVIATAKVHSDYHGAQLIGLTMAQARYEHINKGGEIVVLVNKVEGE